MSTSLEKIKLGKILVVDDEPEMRALICDFLRERGYQVFEAANGESALTDVLCNTEVDLVLSDINMPGMKGFDLLKEVRERYPKTKRVLITAYNVEDYLELAMQHDIGNIFVKTIPFAFDELFTLLKNLINEDIFGLTHYFSSEAIFYHEKVASTLHLDVTAKNLITKVEGIEFPRRLELVMVELLTNAIYYGVCNEASDQKELWKQDITIADDRAIQISIAKDAEKYAFSVRDPGGSLKKSDVLFWLNRQATRDDEGLPIGLFDTHGRGLFIARRYIDRLIINIDPKKQTEVVILNYFADTFKGHKPLYINEL